MNIIVPASTATKHITSTVRVTGMRAVSLRCRLGVLLLKLAAVVFPFNVTIDVESEAR